MPHTIHTKSITERMRWLSELGAEHSRVFAGPEAYLQRRRYRAEHPTAILAFKCMDGRIHLPYITKTPLGIIQPFRNLGGAFDIGWPHLGELVTHAVMRAVEEGRRVLILVTYHYSRGDRSRGCSGFDYDLEAARSSAFAFRRQLESVFGTDHQIVYPLVVGIETDEDALTLHRDRGTALELAEIETGGRAEADLEDLLAHSLHGTFRDMPADIMRDVLPLVIGNLRHIGEVRRTERSLDIQHHEWILCVGRGFDFLHVPNTALIVGPYSPNIDEPIVTAARIIQTNMEAGPHPRRRPHSARLLAVRGDRHRLPPRRGEIQVPQPLRGRDDSGGGPLHPPPDDPQDLRAELDKPLPRGDRDGLPLSGPRPGSARSTGWPRVSAAPNHGDHI